MSSGSSSAPSSRRTSRTASTCSSASGAAASTTWSSEVGAGDLLERRAERLDELVRQLAHEPDGVGQQHRLAAGQPQPPGGGVERGEQAVLDEHAGAREPVEQRRLAGVRVPDERDGVEGRAAAALALRVPRAAEVAQVGLELGDATGDAAAVGLELGLAGAPPGADAAGLARTAGCALAPQPRRQVPQLGQLHLHHALAARGVLGEDVEDQGDAVDDVDLELRSRFRCWAGRELVVEHDDVGVERGHELAHLGELAAAQVRGRVGAVPALHDALERLGAGGVGEQRELVEGAVGVLDVDRVVRQRAPDEHARAGGGRRGRSRSR